MRPDEHTFTDAKQLYGPEAITVFWYGVDYLAQQSPSPYAGRADVLQRLHYGLKILPVKRGQSSPLQSAADNPDLQRMVGLMREGRTLRPGLYMTLQITGYEFDEQTNPAFPQHYCAGWSIIRRYSRFTLHTLHGQTALSVSQHYATTNRLHERGDIRRELVHEIICADLPTEKRQTALALFIQQLAVTPASASLPPALKAIPLSKHALEKR